MLSNHKVIVDIQLTHQNTLCYAWSTTTVLHFSTAGIIILDNLPSYCLNGNVVFVRYSDIYYHWLTFSFASLLLGPNQIHV